MILIFVLWLLISPATVYAYLDPGSGAVLVNIIIAGIAALLYSFKNVILRLFGKNSPIKDQANSKQIGILSEGKQYSATFQPIINAFLEHKIPFSYYTLDIDDPALTIDNELMDSHFLGFKKWGFSRASILKVDNLLCTTPNIGVSGYPIKKSPNIKNLIHIFHSINDLAMYKQGSLDNYDTVLMVGPFQEKSIRELETKRNLKLKKLVSIGLPYLDVYSESNNKDVKNNDSQKTILIGSSWGDKGLLKVYGIDFIKQLVAYDYNVIIRPHPQSYISERDFIKKLKNETKYLHNVLWDDSISPVGSMVKADILISDTSSLRFDFAFIFNKPVITLQINTELMPGYERYDLSSIWMEEAEKKIGPIINKDSIYNINEIIEKAIEEFHPNRIINFRNETVVNYGKAGEAIAEYFSAYALKGDND